MSQQIIQSDMEALRESILKFADDKKLEIETLKEKEDYRKEFIGNISHELKTPLFTIQSYILTLIDGGMDDPNILKKYLKRSSKAIDRLTYLVKDLDLISQFESGVKNIEKEKFDPNNVEERIKWCPRKCCGEDMYHDDYNEYLSFHDDDIEEDIHSRNNNHRSSRISYVEMK